MSEFDRPERYEVIKRGLIKLKLEYKHASKHDVATCPSSGQKTMIPRHKVKTLNKFTVGSIADFLAANGYSKEEIKKAFRWK